MLKIISSGRFVQIYFFKITYMRCTQCFHQDFNGADEITSDALSNQTTFALCLFENDFTFLTLISFINSPEMFLRKWYKS